MSENTNPVINRNNVDFVLSEQVFGKKSDNAGKKFFAPVVDENNFQDAVAWAGIDTVVGIVNKNLRNIFATIYLDNLNTDGTLNMDAWKADAEDFTAGAVRLGDIAEELDELQALQMAYGSDEHFGETDDHGNKTTEALDLEKKIREVSLKIKPLRAKRQQIEEIYKARAEKRKAKQQAAAPVAA